MARIATTSAEIISLQVSVYKCWSSLYSLVPERIKKDILAILIFYGIRWPMICFQKDLLPKCPLYSISELDTFHPC